ncbi:MAG TPA: lamin tail domain-containing protein, partial [Segeticoccus sp.]|uniref:lamin tail domain-containing protein n=1 Tax=Segeticoccus sp. TaxID=2706531 RepID=UPI002D7FBF3D
MPALTLPAPRLRRWAILAAPLLGVGCLAAVAPPAHAVSPNVVVSEAYGGGGNSGATLTNDFIELFNLGDSAVDLSGWKVAYWPSRWGPSDPPYATTPLTGNLGAGRHYLVQEADGSGGTEALPTPDATGTIAMSGSAAAVGVLDAAGNLVDLVGWGSAGRYEKAPAPATGNTTSVARKSACYDTDNNATDFTVGTPSPENTDSTVVDCSTAPPPPTTDATVAEIQGASHLSPLRGKNVTNVPGVVTAKTSDGFYLQSTEPDDNPATSEGIYVFGKGAASSVAVRDRVTVDGSVAEYRPGGAKDNLTTTEITGPTVTVESHHNPLPAPAVIGKDRIAPQHTVYAGSPGSVEYAGVAFDPETNAIDFYESMEGMRVAVDDAEAVGPTNKYGELPVVPAQNVEAQRSIHGGVVYSGYDHPNSMRVIVTTLDSSLRTPRADVGDVLAGETVGVLDYNFSNYMLEATSLGTLNPAGLQREVTTPQTNNQLAVATFNVENLAPTNPSEKFERLAGQIVHNLKSPDILALEEIQDNNGAQDDGVVDSSTTLAKLTAAIRAAGGPAYEARWVNPVNDQDGGQPGGNIRSVFLYRPDRDVQFVDHAPGDATTATGVYTEDGRAHLTHSPGRIDPTSSAWDDSRKPLVGEFTFRGTTVFAIANHFNSKGGDDPLFGKWQPPERFSEPQRHQQAHEVRDFVDGLLSADPSANVVVLGDLNDFEFSETADILVGSGDTKLTDLPRTLAPAERYTYVYEGNSQVLDHILLSPALTVAPPGAKHPAYDYDVVHTNSEFHDQDSDHDPQVVRL